MQPIEAVLFDFGMVLSRPPVPAVWAEMERVSGMTLQTLQRGYWLHRDDYDSGMLQGASYWKSVGDEAGVKLTPTQCAQLMALDVELWTDMNAPMLAWVQALQRAGVRTGILSNMPDAMAEGICRKFDWLQQFHNAVWSHALRLRKPDPAIYAAAASGLAVPVADILFLDDKDENIQAAQDFGMQAILYRDHTSFESEMAERGLAYLLHPEPAPITI